MLELGKPTVVGKWTVARLELRIIMAWREWLVEQVGDPFEDCSKPWFDKLPKEEQLARVKAAEKIVEQLKPHRFSIDCPVSQDAMKSVSGAGYFGRLMLQDHHPDITEEDAFQAWVKDIGPHLDKVMKRAQGKVPGGSGGNGTPPGEAGDLNLIGSGSTSP